MSNNLSELFISLKHILLRDILRKVPFARRLSLLIHHTKRGQRCGTFFVHSSLIANSLKRYSHPRIPSATHFRGSLLTGGCFLISFMRRQRGRATRLRSRRSIWVCTWSPPRMRANFPPRVKGKRWKTRYGSCPPIGRT